MMARRVEVLLARIELRRYGGGGSGRHCGISGFTGVWNMVIRFGSCPRNRFGRTRSVEACSTGTQHQIAGYVLDTHWRDCCPHRQFGPRQRAHRVERRLCRSRGLWPPIHRQPRPSLSISPRSSARRVRPRLPLRRWRAWLHRLSNRARGGLILQDHDAGVERDALMTTLAGTMRLAPW
jgi:hypothetical protein